MVFMAMKLSLAEQGFVSKGEGTKCRRSANHLRKGGQEGLLRRKRRAQLCQVSGCAGAGAPQHRGPWRRHESQAAGLVSGRLIQGFRVLEVDRSVMHMWAALVAFMVFVGDMTVVNLAVESN